MWFGKGLNCTIQEVTVLFTSVNVAVVHDPVLRPPDPLPPPNFPMSLPSFPAFHVPVALLWTSGTLGIIYPSP